MFVKFPYLPAELQNLILQYALVSPNQIIVWAGRLEPCPLTDEERSAFFNHDTSQDQLGPVRWEQTIYTDSAQQTLEGVAPALLVLSRTVAQEAASIFYARNVFTFRGDVAWAVVATWLATIGPRNRGLLTELVLTIAKPHECHQEPDGRRTWYRDIPEIPYPRSPHFAALELPAKGGSVENIDPAVETVFSLLGHCEHRSKLTVRLWLQYMFLPGVELWEGSQSAYRYYWSLDLPNLIESFRVHATRGRDIDVLWEGEARRPEFEKCERSIKAQWVIVIAEEGNAYWEPGGIEPVRRPAQPPGPRTLVVPTTLFTLRRKTLPTPLTAADPSPYSIASGGDVAEPPYPFHISVKHCSYSLYESDQVAY
jgi:hypothetical protein